MILPLAFTGGSIIPIPLFRILTSIGLLFQVLLAVNPFFASNPENTKKHNNLFVKHSMDSQISYLHKLA